MHDCARIDPYLSRRSVLRSAMGCGAYAFLAWSGAAWSVRRAFASAAAGDVIKTEPWARVEKLTDGLWAIVSTPFENNALQTMSNGGIIAGKDGVLIVEGFNSTEGGAWAAKLARELTGRAPTHVALTHHHRDHSNGLSAYLGAEPVRIISLQKTRELHANQHKELPGRLEDVPTGLKSVGANFVLPDVIIPEDAESASVDLGGRIVTLRSRIGHTPGDMTIEIDEPRVVWCGDLVFNGLFPYYGDAIPSKLSATCRTMLTESGASYVPGHGAVANAEGLKPYLGLLDEVEAAARKAHAAGTPAEEAWKAFEPSENLGEWRKFRPDVYRFAFEAWERELKGASGGPG